MKNKFKFLDTEIKGVKIIEPSVFDDSRGYFMEAYNRKDFEANGIKYNFVQDNESSSKKGVLRGLHTQVKRPQGKLVRVVKGKVFDVAVDINPKSPTFGKYVGVELSSDNKRLFFIPPGLAHGFLVLSEEATFCYKCTDFYNPSDELGIMWNDKDLAIDWPIYGVDLIISEKDKANCLLKDLKR